MQDNTVLNDLKKMYVEGGAEVGTLVYIPIDQIYPHPDNPRKELGDLTELADSIRSKGIMQNLTVVPRSEGGYTVIIGHRRSEAARLAEIPAVPCIIAEMSEREQVATMLLENMQRVDLTAYEQAQGFQMMIDFGESVESIAEKTGFSKKTVRGRLKMAELDAGILKDVSASRQISIGDLDKLSQIEDIEKRNTLLKQVGTNNFEQSFSRALKQQRIDRNLPRVYEAIKAIKGKKIERSETYGGKYRKIDDISIDDFKGAIEIPEKHAADKIFYNIDEYWGTLGLYVLVPKAEPVKRSKEEIEREKRIKDAHATLEALAREAYELRFAFIKALKVTKANVDAVKEGAFLAMLSEQHWYNSHINKREVYVTAAGIEGIKELYMTSDVLDRVLSAYREDPRRLYPSMIYVSFGDSRGEGFHSTYKHEYPKHQANRKLVMLYEWLTSLGYEMSDDERGMMDGSHPIFGDGKDGEDQ